jgi:hypothetical protein
VADPGEWIERRNEKGKTLNKSKKRVGSAERKARDIQDMLRARLADKTLHWVTPQRANVTGAMAKDGEAQAAWRAIGCDVAQALKFIEAIRQSLVAALLEIQRPPSKAERQAVERVIQLSAELDIAIRDSTLPGGWIRQDGFGLYPEGLPEVNIDMGWHSLDSPNFGYALSVCEVLEWAKENAKKHLEALPVRAVTRKPVLPHVTAFVRHLAWHFNRLLGKEPLAAIAHITSAIFTKTKVGHPTQGLPIDALQVKLMLKNRPAPFVPKPKEKKAIA